MLGTNRDDAVKMLEKYCESAGKSDNKPSENEGTGKTLGKRTLKMKKYTENQRRDRRGCRNCRKT